MRRKLRKGISLKWGLISVIIIFWGLPLLVIFTIMGYYASVQARQQLNKTIVNSVESAVEVTQGGIVNAMDLMRASSFETNMKNAVAEYSVNSNKTKLYENIMQNLTIQYSGSNSFRTSMIFLCNEPDTIYYVGNHQNSNTLKRVNIYKDTVHSTVKAIEKRLEDKIRFLAYDNTTLYMIRALSVPNTNPYAVLVMEVNVSQLFRGLNSVVWLSAATANIDNVRINVKGIGVKVPNEAIIVNGISYAEQGTTIRVKKNQIVEDHDVVYQLRIDSSPLWDCFSALENMLLPMIFFIIPILATLIWMFYKFINKPLESMVAAATEIQTGKLGYQITEIPKSQEFSYLVKNFNDMSRNTKEQFERSYNEQVALQNERMKALQSQINPHFLNNTLEIINWEARIAGNQQVSDMIEALSTMLSAAMHRSGKTKATLQEELEVVNAYLYIISVRIGSGLVVKSDIDQSLLHIVVPCMILQPVVENAVEHGITPKQHGELNIRIYSKQNILVIEVENDGPFTIDDQSNVDRLLNWNGAEDKGARSIEVGIRNVNHRLKLLYGKDMGLSIYRTNRETTMAKIILPMTGDHNHNKSQ